MLWGYRLSGARFFLGLDLVPPKQWQQGQVTPSSS